MKSTRRLNDEQESMPANHIGSVGRHLGLATVCRIAGVLVSVLVTGLPESLGAQTLRIGSVHVSVGMSHDAFFAAARASGLRLMVDADSSGVLLSHQLAGGLGEVELRNRRVVWARKLHAESRYPEAELSARRQEVWAEFSSLTDTTRCGVQHEASDEGDSSSLEIKCSGASFLTIFYNTDAQPTYLIFAIAIGSEPRS